jgi:GNAT superfamily N-acetyltransferase
MSNALPVQEWLDVIRDEYLDGFVKDGGSTVKFVVPTKEGLGPLLQRRLEGIASQSGYLAVNVAAGETRVHMPQEIFFRVAEQMDWRLLARRMVLRLCEELPYQTDAIDPLSDTPILQAISAANGVEKDQVSMDLRRKLPGAVTQNRGMSRDFREAMAHLCITEMDGDGRNPEETPLLEWLTGRSRRISNVRAYSIYNSIARTNARHFLESLLYWVRFVGYSGTMILLNDARVTLRRNPRDGLRFYSRSAVMDHYELLRELIDSADRLPGLMMVVMATDDFLDPDERGKGFHIYRALMGRIAEEVRDRNRSNPMSTLVRLAEST